MDIFSKVVVLVNPQSGTRSRIGELLDAIQSYWDTPRTDLYIRLTNSPADGRRKAAAARDDGAEMIVAVGGDGAVNSIGSELIDSDVVLGVIPTGSGNGFARHFAIPLEPRKAARKLREGTVKPIDVGTVNDKPFIVTTSMAWETSIVEAFERMPVRGIIPYVLSAMYGVVTYTPQPFDVTFDDGTTSRIEEPMICTVANLTQYGGGVQVAPDARPDDGRLELVYMERTHLPRLLAYIPKLVEGQHREVPNLHTRPFRTLHVARPKPAPIQVDGELIATPTDLEFGVLPRALRVLVPAV